MSCATILKKFKKLILNKMKNTQTIPQDEQPKKWLSSDDVCNLLLISKRTLQNYRDRGIIPFAQIGRKIYYKASDIEEYLSNHYIRAYYQKGGAA
jgi:excisionase family DNA binding protein